MNKFAEFVKLSGLPDGVFQIINGTVNAVTSLCNHNDIKAVTFVGSSKVAKIVHNDQNDPALQGEIFGPVLSILKVESREEAIRLENNNQYGNAACICVF